MLPVHQNESPAVAIIHHLDPFRQVFFISTLNVLYHFRLHMPTAPAFYRPWAPGACGFSLPPAMLRAPETLHPIPRLDPPLYRDARALWVRWTAPSTKPEQSHGLVLLVFLALPPPRYCH